MKILLVNVVYRKGSTGFLVNSLQKYYREHGYESYFAYGRGPKVKEANVYKCGFEFESNVHHFFANLNGDIYGGSFFSTNRLIHHIKKIEPDIVHLHCINGYFVNIYRLLNFLKEKRIKTVLTNHAEFMYTANCGYTHGCDGYLYGCRNCRFVHDFNGKRSHNHTGRYFAKLMKVYDGFAELTMTYVSPWLTGKFHRAPQFRKIKMETVLNGVNPLFKNEDQKKARERLGWPLDQKIVLYMNPIAGDPNKGAQFLPEVFKGLSSDCFFALVGVKAPGGFNNAISKPYSLTIEQIKDCYAAADVTLLLSRHETFSMLTAESLACGTPVVGFQAGGPESIALPAASCFVGYGDIPALLKAIKESLNKDWDRAAISEEARKEYSLERMAEGYLSIYREALGHE